MTEKVFQQCLDAGVPYDEAEKIAVATWAEYYRVCEQIRKTRDMRDTYERLGKREAAKTAKVRLMDLMHRKLELELQLSNELARAS